MCKFTLLPCNIQHHRRERRLQRSIACLSPFQRLTWKSLMSIEQWRSIRVGKERQILFGCCYLRKKQLFTSFTQACTYNIILLPHLLSLYACVQLLSSLLCMRITSKSATLALRKSRGSWGGNAHFFSFIIAKAYGPNWEIRTEATCLK